MVSTNEVVVESAPVVNIPTEPANAATAGPEDDFDKAQKKFQLGKKNLLLNKYDDAVNNIGDACKSYSTKFGEFAPECGEVYFYYGKALLELARVENTVLGNALSGVPEDTGPIDDSRYGNPDDVAAEEQEEIADKVIDAMCESTEQQQQQQQNSETTPAVESTTTTTEKPVEVAPAVETPKEGEQQAKDGEAVSSSNEKKEEEPVVEPKPAAEEGESKVVEGGEKKEGEEAAEDGDDDGEDEDGGDEADEEDLTKNDDAKAADETEAEDISNLQRAWEMFELAKLVFTKNFDNDPSYKSKRIAECLIKLGEISIEQELYEQALTDIKESIRMQEEKQASERDDRMLAESYYQFGLAHQFSEQFQLAGEQYQKSINILQLRIDKLKGLIEQTSDDFEKTTFKDEITELEAILPEMVSKLEEIKEQGEQSLKLIKEAKECFLNKVGEDGDANKTAAAATNGEVKDITCLVKSKRKAESNDVTTVKKTKVDETAEVMSTEQQPQEEEAQATPIETDPPVEEPKQQQQQQIDEQPKQNGESAEQPVENGTA